MENLNYEVLKRKSKKRVSLRIEREVVSIEKPTLLTGRAKRCWLEIHLNEVEEYVEENGLAEASRFYDYTPFRLRQLLQDKDLRLGSALMQMRLMQMVEEESIKAEATANLYQLLERQETLGQEKVATDEPQTLYQLQTRIGELEDGQEYYKAQYETLRGQLGELLEGWNQFIPTITSGLQPVIGAFLKQALMAGVPMPIKEIEGLGTRRRKQTTKDGLSKTPFGRELDRLIYTGKKRRSRPTSRARGWSRETAPSWG